jgi:hypothetical protein
LFKQRLTNSTADTTSLPQLKSVVAQLDLKQQEYDRHRRGERDEHPMQRTQTYPVVDVPMEIDAARVNAARNGSNKTRSDWLAAMRRRCFNCAGTTLLRYVTQEPNLRVKRSCTSLGNVEVFLFGFIVSKDYVLGWTLSRLLYDWSDVT